MRKVIIDEESGWMKVTNEIPQGSVLAPIIYLIYMNDMMCDIMIATPVCLLMMQRTGKCCQEALKDFLIGVKNEK